MSITRSCDRRDAHAVRISCLAVDFHVELPAFRPLTLRLDGGANVKELIAAALVF